MDVINVVEIENGVLTEIHSFGILDEESKREAIKEAEDKFEKLVEQCIPEGCDLEDICEHDSFETIIENGYFEGKKPYGGAFADYSVCISWSYIENVQI